MFSRLSHVEFDYESRKFSVLPTTLLVNSEYGILCGARTKELIKNLDEKYPIETIENYNAPKIIKVGFDDIIEFHNDFPDILIAKDFTQKVLDITDSLDEYKQKLKKMETPLNCNKYSVRYYNPDEFSFEDKMIEEVKTGLYEDKDFSKNKYYYYDNDWFYVSKDWGRLLALKELSNNSDKIIQYNNQTKEFKIYKYVKLPAMVDRALALMSGQNIRVVENYTIYANIKESIADKVMELFL